MNEYRRKHRIRLLYEVVETSVFRKKIGVEAWRGVFIFLRPCPRKRRAVDSGLSVFTNPARCLVISAESFDFVIGIYKILEKENLSELDYFMYQIVFDYLVRTTEFFPIYNKMASLPSDAKCHILHRYAANKFSENIYKEIKYKYPIQKLNANLPFIKNCLLYETILREKF